MTRAVVAVAAAAVLASSLMTGTTASAAPGTSTITWGTCTDPALAASGAECGFLPVPLDHARPWGEKIQLAVSRIKHKVPDAQYQGVMLTLVTPGVSGLRIPLLSRRVPNRAAEAYDWIGVDTRGVGASKPALSCDPNYYGQPNRPSYVPTTPAIEQAWLDRAKGYAQACEKNNPRRLLENMRTTDIVKDMEFVRRALGQRQLNLYGLAWGTYYAQVYATLHGRHVRRMVFDSAVDPRGIWYRPTLGFGAWVGRSFDFWLDWLAQHDDVYRLGKTRSEVQQLLDDTQRKLTAQPAGGVIGPSELIDVIGMSPYSQARWPALGTVFSNFVHKGDWQTVKALYESSGANYFGSPGDNGSAAYLAITCTDGRWASTWQKFRADTWRATTSSPYLTWQNSWFAVPCMSWPVKASNPISVRGHRAQSVLMITSGLNAGMPLDYGLEVRDRFPGAVLITEPAGTDTAAGLRGNACVDTRIADYLATGALPDRKRGNTADVECASLPQPTP